MDEKRQQRVVYPPLPSTLNGLTTVAPQVAYIQTTRSRGHAWPSAGRGKTDCGGDFSTAKILSVRSINSQISNAVYQGYTFSGREFPVQPQSAVNNALAAVAPRSELYYIQKGTTAVARSLPTNPVADAGTFIGELKAGLPRTIGKELFKTKFKDYRKVGSEYLNVEFGWKPLISDLQKFAKAANQSEKIVNQLLRDSGKNIRRSFTFPDEQVVTRTVNNALSVSATGTTITPNLHYSATGAPLEVVTTTTTRTWFSGCFTYHVNLGNTLPDRISRAAAEARKLYGIELTPETVWNLAPWSWAVDWEGNVGDVLHNVSRFSQDGLVMRYGYLMQETTCKIDYTLGWQGRFKTAQQSNLTFSITSQRKERRRATPFGFGFDMTALSGRQSAILGALGISRGPRHL